MALFIVFVLYPPQHEQEDAHKSSETDNRGHCQTQNYTHTQSRGILSLQSTKVSKAHFFTFQLNACET